MSETIAQVLYDLAHLVPDGESGIDAAEVWADESFSPHEVRAWVEAGVWNPDAAAFLRHHGAYPTMAALLPMANGEMPGGLLSAGEMDSLEALTMLGLAPPEARDEE